MSDDQTDDDDEILTPEVVDDGRPLGEPPDRPDRRPIWAMAAGLGAVASLVLFPLLTPILAAVGIIQGRKLLRELNPNDDAVQQSRKRGKVGLVGGITALVLFVAWFTYFTVFYDPPDRLVPDFVDDKATSEPAG